MTATTSPTATPRYAYDVRPGDIIGIYSGSGARTTNGQPLRRGLTLEVTKVETSEATGRTYAEGYHVTTALRRRKGEPVRAAYISGREVTAGHTGGDWIMVKPAPEETAHDDAQEDFPTVLQRVLGDSRTHLRIGDAGPAGVTACGAVAVWRSGDPDAVDCTQCLSAI